MDPAAFLEAQARPFAFANTPWMVRPGFEQGRTSSRNPKKRKKKRKKGGRKREKKDYWTEESISVTREHEYNGYTIYRGPSVLDGKPIIVLATAFKDPSENIKTGKMIQTWIMREDLTPQEAIWTGEDISICGTCVHRGETIKALKKGWIGRRYRKSRVSPETRVPIPGSGRPGTRKRRLPKSKGRSCYVVISQQPREK